MKRNQDKISLWKRPVRTHDDEFSENVEIQEQTTDLEMLVRAYARGDLPPLFSW